MGPPPHTRYVFLASSAGRIN